MRTLSLFLLVLLMLDGCNLLGVGDGDVLTDPAHTSLRTGQSAYVSGAEVVLHLENATDSAFGYNLCFAELQREVGGAWVRTTLLAENTFCPAVLRTLQPGETATYTHRLPSTLPEGRYRFEAEVEQLEAGTHQTLVSNLFTLVR